MRIAVALVVFSAVCVLAIPSMVPPLQNSEAAKATPLILEKNEGERRVVRPWPGHPDPGESFILKVDPKNGGSSHLVLLTGDLAPGGEIPVHKHPSADEILFLQNGTARIHEGNSERVVHAGAIVFIPAGTWISVTNIGKEHLEAVGIFSSPGFEEYMRDVSVREGEKNVPMTQAEDAAAAQKHVHDAIYQ